MQPLRSLASSALLATALLAAFAAPAVARTSSFCGAARFTGRSCVIVPGSLGSVGRTFDISGVSPMPTRNSTISGSGTVRGISRCAGANSRLVHVSWRRMAVCPLAR